MKIGDCVRCQNTFQQQFDFDNFVSIGVPGKRDNTGDDLFERRTERRRIAAIILYRLIQSSSIACDTPGVSTMTAKEVTSALFLPSVVYFLSMVVQENRLAKLSGEARLLMGTEGRHVYHMSTEAALLALVAIARLNPEGDVQPRARNDVASTLMTHHVVGKFLPPILKPALIFTASLFCPKTFTAKSMCTSSPPSSCTPLNKNKQSG